jgi:hypothetical protein
MDQPKTVVHPHEVDSAPLVVEIERVVPSPDVPWVAELVAKRLGLPEWRVRRLIAARVGPVTHPMRPEKAEMVVRIFEEAGVVVSARASQADGAVFAGRQVAPEALRSEETVVPADVRSVGERPVPRDDHVTAVLAGLIAVAKIDGTVSEAALGTIRRALASMTGTDVGLDSVERLSRARYAGDLARAATLLAELEPALDDDEKDAILELFLEIAEPGQRRAVKVLCTEYLADVLRMPPYLVRARVEAGVS